MGLGDLFGGGGSKDPEPLYPWAGEAAEKITNAGLPGATQYAQTAGNPYQGLLSAPMSGLENTAFSGYEKLLSQSPTDSPMFQQIGSTLQNLLTNQFDPAEGDYYQAYKANILRELNDAKSRLAKQTSSRDQYFSSGRIAGEGELEETTLGNLMQTLAGLYENDRNRQLQAAGVAQNYAALGQNMNLQQLASGLTAGAQQRGIGQEALNRNLLEYQRQRQEQGNFAQSLLGNASNLAQMAYVQPNNNTLGGLGQLIGAIGIDNIMGGLGGIGGLMGIGGAGLAGSGLAGGGLGAATAGASLSGGISGSAAAAALAGL